MGQMFYVVTIYDKHNSDNSGTTSTTFRRLSNFPFVSPRETELWLDCHAEDIVGEYPFGFVRKYEHKTSIVNSKGELDQTVLGDIHMILGPQRPFTKEFPWLHGHETCFVSINLDRVEEEMKKVGWEIMED